MKTNYIQLMKDLGYSVNSLKTMESEKIIWFRKKNDEYIVKDIMINFEKEWISCQTNYYLKNGNLGKREGIMTFTEFEYIKGILEQGFDEQIKIMKGEYMDEINFKDLNSIIEYLKRSRDNINNILEEQTVTIFHSRDYYEGQLDAYETAIDILEIYQKKGE